MCNHQNREAAMVTVEDGVWCDPCLEPIIKALNEAGLPTVASCCGHGDGPGRISLKDGRELFLLPDFGSGSKAHELLIRHLFGEAPQVSAQDELATLIDRIEKFINLIPGEHNWVGDLWNSTDPNIPAQCRENWLLNAIVDWPSPCDCFGPNHATTCQLSARSLLLEEGEAAATTDETTGEPLDEAPEIPTMAGTRDGLDSVSVRKGE